MSNKRFEYFATTPWVENTEFGEPWTIWLFTDEIKDWQLVGECQTEKESEKICKVLNTKQYDLETARKFIEENKNESH